MTGPSAGVRSEPVCITCQDGYRLAGDLWLPDAAPCAAVIINPATGVRAGYYHRYARFLAEAGLASLTYDYRGIGGSRPARLRGSGITWRNWGERDFEATVTFMEQGFNGSPLLVVGHSIGGFLPGFAPGAARLARILTVGAQFAYWPDYLASRRPALVLKWHVLMPALTVACGYFPGQRLGWLEDLPAGVALEWGFRRARFERSYLARDRAAILARFAAVQAPILAVRVADDEFGTARAIRRALSPYTGSERTEVRLRPRDLGFACIGHFGLFHDRHRDGFWRASLAWLREGINPWPGAVEAC